MCHSVTSEFNNKELKYSSSKLRKILTQWNVSQLAQSLLESKLSKVAFTFNSKNFVGSDFLQKLGQNSLKQVRQGVLLRKLETKIVNRS